MSHPEPDALRARRELLVERHLAARGITDSRVLEAMRQVPRHEFLPPSLQQHAYEDRPLPIGQGQTISQPWIVALMVQLAELRPDSRVLDVGTGSGYQAAVLSRLLNRVESVEIVPELAESAARRLRELGYDNVTVHCADGSLGWPPGAPWDAIIAAAAPEEVPPALVEQLASGGRLILPVGAQRQELLVVRKEADGSVSTRHVIPVAFVPMTGAGGKSEPADQK